MVIAFIRGRPADHKGNTRDPSGKTMLANDGIPVKVSFAMKLAWFPSFAVLTLTSAHVSVWAGDKLLFDHKGLGSSTTIAGWVTNDATVVVPERPGAGLRIQTGHQQPWPGVTLRAPGKGWDLSEYGRIEVKLKNLNTNSVTVSCRADNEGADGTQHCVSGSVTLKAGEAGILSTVLKRAHDDTLEGKLFGMRGYPVSAEGPNTIDATGITQLLLFVSKPQVDHQFEVDEIRATGSYTPPTAWVSDAEPFFPFINTFGQYRHKDWPGKIESPEDLQNRRKDEAKELARHPGPKDWDIYGGWNSGPQLKATGFFRTEKVKNKWWLIDPDGHLFFSQGIDCVGAFDRTPIQERENWFADFPGNQPEFAGFRSRGFALKGHYAGHSPECYSFLSANLARKYGSDWQESYPRLTHQRLRSWGLNTIANWSDAKVRRLRLTPYTDAISSGRTKPIAGSEGYWGKFPDVFDPSFAEGLRHSMEAKRGDSAADPWCIGYFSDNEMSWGDELSLALAALQSPPEQAAKVALVAELKTKYENIGKLNLRWASHYDSWEDLARSRVAPDKTKASADLADFYTHIAGQYFHTVREVIKAVAPNHLYLGCRFAWVNSRAAAAAAKYCDVVSYNLYRRSVADFEFNGGADVPLMIGEFHFGALDRGLFHTGLVPVGDQRARAQAYKDYVLGALHHPQFVGCHWFQFYDEPTTGRTYDEENYQIGFVDIADTPYTETIEASREIGAELYKKWDGAGGP